MNNLPYASVGISQAMQKHFGAVFTYFTATVLEEENSWKHHEGCTNFSFMKLERKRKLKQFKVTFPTE